MTATSQNCAFKDKNRLKRYLILSSAVVMQMCLGATYSWSVYVKPLKELTGLSQGPVQLPFSLFYFAFPATMMLSGTLLPRLGPKRCAVAGGLVFGSGWLLAALGSRHFVFTLLGIGLLGGVGVGLAYIVPLAVCVQWFPRHKGLVTGLAVAGFGGGAALVSQIAGKLMNDGGKSPFETFRILGLAFLVLVSCAGLAMQYAPEVKKKGITRLMLSEVVGRREFWILYIAMFTGLAAGFAVNANLKELAPGLDLETGLLAVSSFAIANALGRIIWGMVFDRSRSAAAIQVNLLFQAVVLASSIWLFRWQVGFLLFALLAGFNYGGVLVLYAASTTRIWGNEQVGQVYGLLFSANIPAALSPVIAGFGYDVFGHFTLSLVILTMLMIAAALWVGKNASLLNSG